MSERDPLHNLRDLIDEPVAPREAFADELRSRLMRELSASNASREEHPQPMDTVIAPRPPLAFPIESPRRIRPLVILELAAAAIIILGLAATLGRGWFANDPEEPTSVPAAALQGDETPTPASQAEQTPVGAIPTMAPEEAQLPTSEIGAMIPTESPDGSMQPTVVPQGNFPGTVWTLPGTDGDQVDIGGLLVDDDTVYRLMATSSFVGIQAVDAESGSIEWQQAYRWAGNLLTIEDDTLYFDGSGNTLTAVDAQTGTQRWQANIPGNLRAFTDEDDRIFVLLDNDMVAALDELTGEQLWASQGSLPPNASGGSASEQAGASIAVEGKTVAVISTSGVLSGFDVQTGEELWSYEGYEAATSSIQTEDDRFVVIDAAGIWVDGQEVEFVGTPSAGAPSNQAGGLAGCADLFAGSVTGPATQLPPTPAGGVMADRFRVQAIDPATGDILWERQTEPGIGIAWNQAPYSAAAGSICAIDVKNGDVVSPTGSDDESSGDNVVIGSISDGVFYTGIFDDDMQAIGSVLGSVAQAPGSEVIFAIAEDGSVFLQQADGTLVRVDTDHVDNNDDHDEDHDSDSDETPTTEFDDD
ncbi:MAG TPA: PQQ-binding-like beta-propeller repeat protein [Thermomicrobiales bacterium]|nr:PQQ-binding-like beta-propeller repeat protein [Thermomicrobiales bacterium]